MAYTTIDDPTIYFNTVLYTGDGNSSKTITGVGFQPDWIWIKKRSGTASHMISDSVRGVTKTIYTEATSQELTTDQYGWVSAFGTDGFTTSNTNVAAINENSETHVVWNWKAGGSASSNSDGSTTTSVSASTAAGFSIAKWTGDGGATTLGHGLGAVPKWILVKTLDRSENWVVYHVGNDASAPEDKSIRLDGNNAVQDNNTHFNDTAPTSSVFSVGASNGVNPNGEDQIAYCFAEKKGYSKFGSYTGNGNADGTYVYLGFRPAWVLVKKTSSADDWALFDNKRDVDNVTEHLLRPNTTAAEEVHDNFKMDLLSNGFRLKTTDGKMNGSGASYIFMAFAESPFVNSNGVPCNAR